MGSVVIPAPLVSEVFGRMQHLTFFLILLICSIDHIWCCKKYSQGLALKDPIVNGCVREKHVEEPQAKAGVYDLLDSDREDIPGYCKGKCVYLKRNSEKTEYCFTASSEHPNAISDRQTALWYSDPDCDKEETGDGQGFTIEVEVNSTDVAGNVNFAIGFNRSERSNVQISGDHLNVRLLDLNVEFTCADEYPINYPILKESDVAPVACFAEEKIDAGFYTLEVKNKNIPEDGTVASPEDIATVFGMWGGECRFNSE